MSMVFEKDINAKAVMDVAEKMAAAARTAPKGRGVDNLAIALVSGADIIKIADKMKEMDQKYGVPGFSRDAGNLMQSSAMLLLGTKIKPLGLKKCGLCGFSGCAEKEKYPNIPCSFNTGDLGIAVGSAVSIAMDNRIDNRIMYSAGMAALELNIFDTDIKIIYGIPLSATAKNPFFDRK